MGTVYENTTGNDWNDLMTSAWVSDGIGPTTSSANNITQITVYLLRIGSPSGNVQAHIYSCSDATTCDASPAYSSNETLTASSISTSETAYTFTFSGSPDLTTYDRIVITVTGGDSSNKIRIRITTLSIVSGWARSADNASSGWYQNSSQNIKGSVEGSVAPPPADFIGFPPPPLVVRF